MVATPPFLSVSDVLDGKYNWLDTLLGHDFIMYVGGGEGGGGVCVN